MTQQRSTYPLDSTNDPTEKDRHPESAMARMKDAATEAQDYAGKVTEQAREYGEKAQEAARNFKPFLEKSMKEQPIATLAVASVIGFVLGALWKK
jgi:ElaB/YqjD/DUF883 family membrane-anchored ribosome-binding protein